MASPWGLLPARPAGAPRLRGDGGRGPWSPPRAPARGLGPRGSPEDSSTNTLFPFPAQNPRSCAQACRFWGRAGLLLRAPSWSASTPQRGSPGRLPYPEPFAQGPGVLRPGALSSCSSTASAPRPPPLRSGPSSPTFTKGTSSPGGHSTHTPRPHSEALVP